jgi:hypothetical protein
MAQQSLGDVAGSIELKHTEGQSVVIDQNSVGRMRRGPSERAEGDFFSQVLSDCLTETRSLNNLLEVARAGEAFYREDWRDRIEERGLRLESASEELRLVQAEGRYQQAYELAEYGALTANDALGIVRGAIEENRPVFSEARRLSKEAIRALEDAHKAIGVVARAEAAQEPAPPINPIEANRVMTVHCGQRYEPGSSAFDSCIAAQRAAVDSMAGRSAPDAGLDPSTFNVIRNNCRFEWSEDFVNQDRCERQRIAAKQ